MDWSHRFHDTITYAEGDTYTDGDWSASTQATATGRLVQKDRQVRLADGTMRSTTHEFATTVSVGLGARVWLAGTDTGDVGESLTVMHVETAQLLDASYRLYILRLGAGSSIRG